jgi:hypothetical protein
VPPFIPAPLSHPVLSYVPAPPSIPAPGHIPPASAPVPVLSHIPVPPFMSVPSYIPVLLSTPAPPSHPVLSSHLVPPSKPVSLSMATPESPGRYRRCPNHRMHPIVSPTSAPMMLPRTIRAPSLVRAKVLLCLRNLEAVLTVDFKGCAAGWQMTGA